MVRAAVAVTVVAVVNLMEWVSVAVMVMEMVAAVAAVVKTTMAAAIAWSRPPLKPRRSCRRHRCRRHRRRRRPQLGVAAATRPLVATATALAESASACERRPRVYCKQIVSRRRHQLRLCLSHAPRAFSAEPELAKRPKAANTRAARTRRE